MAYVGIQTMLLAYKMRKSDKEFELMQITEKRLAETRNQTKVSQEYIDAKSELDKDDPNYAEDYKELEAQYNIDLAEIAEMEDELDTKKASAESEIAYLNNYIESWQSALQQNVGKAHQYGPQ